MQYYSAIKRIYVATWTNIKNIRETSKHKTTYCTTPFIWNSRKGRIITTETRFAVAWVGIGERDGLQVSRRKHFGAGMFCLDCGGGNIIVYNYQNAPACTLKMGEFYCRSIIIKYKF